MIKDKNKHYQLVKDRRNKLISLGICCKCGKYPIYKTSKRFCENCLIKSRKKAKIYRDTFPEKVAIAKKISTSKNPEKYRKIKKNFWERNKPEWNRYARERRALKLKIGGTFSNQEWKDLLKVFGNKCLCCGSAKRLEADHVIPLSRSGTNTIDNIQPLCRTCNATKHIKIIDFRPFGNSILEWT